MTDDSVAMNQQPEMFARRRTTRSTPSASDEKVATPSLSSREREGRRGEEGSAEGAGSHETTAYSFNASNRSQSGEEPWMEEGDASDGGIWSLETGARFVIADNLRVFNAAIHTLSRFSDQLHFEPNATGLALKAITNSQSAFASFHFKAAFFAEADVLQISPDEYNICRISMKCALANFNCFSRTAPLAYCLCIDPNADVMVVKTRMPFHLSKSSVINLRECAATYRHLFSDKSKLENQIAVSPAVLLAVLPQIGSDVDELKLVADPDKVTLERYIKDVVDRNHYRKSQATLDVDTLDLYSIRRPGQVCFRLKEFKSILHFASQCGLSISIHFDMPGKPVVVALEENVDFDAEFTLGTFPLPSHELERLMAAPPRITEATTLRNTIGSVGREQQSGGGDDDAGMEGGGVTGERQPLQVDNALGGAGRHTNNSLDRRVEEVRHQQEDEEMEDMRLGDSASVMMMQSVGGRAHSTSQQQLPPQLQAMEIDEWRGGSGEMRLQELPRHSQMEVFQRNFLALSQVTRDTAEHSTRRAGQVAHASFLEREIYGYESPDDGGEEEAEHDERQQRKSGSNRGDDVDDRGNQGDDEGDPESSYIA